MFKSMRILLTAAVAALLTAAVADAQYKVPAPAPAPAKAPGGVQVAPNKNIQIEMAQPNPVEDELASARRIPRDEAMKLVKAKKAVYIDVRSKETYDESHIPGAINIPLSQLLTRLRDLPPKKFLITYCA